MYFDTLNKKLLTVQENNICLNCQLTTWEACIWETSAFLFTVSEFDSTVLGYFIPLIKWVHRVPVNRNKVNVLCETEEGCGDTNKHFCEKESSLYIHFCVSGTVFVLNLPDAFASSLRIGHEAQAAGNTGQISPKGKRYFKSQYPASLVMATMMK